MPQNNIFEIYKLVLVEYDIAYTLCIKTLVIIELFIDKMMLWALSLTHDCRPTQCLVKCTKWGYPCPQKFLYASKLFVNQYFNISLITFYDVG